MDRTAKDLSEIGAKWLDRIAAVENEKRFHGWVKDAEEAEKAYLCDDTGEKGGTVPDFNILHSNVETIVPAIYNSTPVPDIRPRHGSRDPVSKLVSDVYERVIAVQIDDSRLDAEVEKAAQDAFVAGRGVVRVRFDADVSDMGIANERLMFEVVPWADYREGPSKRWENVPWVAYAHWLSREQLAKIEDEAFASAYSEEGDDEAVEGKVWEIWCKSSGKVYFVTENGKLIKETDDPLGLSGFFPQAEPVQPIMGTGNRTPVCPYKVYRRLAKELDTVTARINKLTSALRARGVSAGDLGIMEAIRDLDDGDIGAAANAENLMAQGGLEKAIMWWPIDKIIVTIRELYVQREQTKQAIYEITGISDIVRGASEASETATAQQIKTQWGSLRIKKMQRLIERQVRDLFVICAEIIAGKFSVETLQAASGIQIPDEALGLLQKPLDHYRVNVESDSTIRADVARNREEMTNFLGGTAQFFSSMAPLVQSDAQAAEPIAAIYGSFAKQFNLGREAEDALDQLVEKAREKAKEPPQPSPEAQAMQADMQMKAGEGQAKTQQAQADLELKQQQAQMQAALEAAKLQLERDRLELDRQRLAMDGERDRVAALGKDAETVGMLSDGSNVIQQAATMAAQVAQAEIAASEQRIMSSIEMLAQAIGQANQQIIAAMTAPKELIRDGNGRPVGVKTVMGEQRVN
jgi:hypothetical protein